MVLRGPGGREGAGLSHAPVAPPEPRRSLSRAARRADRRVRAGGRANPPPLCPPPPPEDFYPGGGEERLGVSARGGGQPPPMGSFYSPPDPPTREIEVFLRANGVGGRAAPRLFRARVNGTDEQYVNPLAT